LKPVGETFLIEKDLIDYTIIIHGQWYTIATPAETQNCNQMNPDIASQNRSCHRKVAILAACVAVLGGCASAGSPENASAATESSFGNLLVIGVAGNYDSRAYFERSVVAGLRAKGLSAAAYHEVVGGNKPLSRELVRDALSRCACDAAVVTSVLDTDADVNVKGAVTGTKVSRKEGRAVDLFRYDYEEINEPLSLSIDTKITFSTDLYGAKSESRLWSGSSKSRRVDSDRCQTARSVRFPGPLKIPADGCDDAVVVLFSFCRAHLAIVLVAQ
jgi:hypothetical protein